MEILIKIIQFFLCFTLLVGIHELGHFLAARLFGIRVDKFYIFFDPWFSLFRFRRGETEYGVGWLPLGGYCKIAGMVDESMDTEQLRRAPQPWEFRSQKAWKRLVVLLAGVTMNLLLAVAIYIGISYAWGTQYFANDDARYGYTFNEEAASLGFRDGDRIVSIDGSAPRDFAEIPMSLLLTEEDRRVEVERDGERLTLTLPFERLVGFRRAKGYEGMMTPRLPFVIDSLLPAGGAAAAGLRPGDELVAFEGRRTVDFNRYTALFREHAGEEVALDVRRGDSLLTLRARLDADGKLGAVVAMPGYAMRTQHYTLLQAIPAGIRATGKVIGNYWQQLRLIVQPKTQMYEELGGFLAIGSVFSSEWNWLDFWQKCAFISIILAVMNLLPIPGLDGGHALFTLWELVTGRRPGDRFLETAQYAGLIFLFALLLYANGNDIYRFFIK